jgi:ribosomal protein S18 acetylase RimI-like enzyme
MSITEQIAENFYIFREFYGRIPSSQIHQAGKVTMVNTGVPYASWNAIFSRAGDLASIESEITEYISNFHLPCSWWIGPEWGQSELGEILQKNGFNAGEQTAAMALDIEDFDMNLSLDREIEILKVSTNIELEQYLQVVKRGFHLPLYCIEALYSLFSQNSSSEDAKIYHYIGRIKGKTIASASLFCAAAAAGIFYVGVLPGMRGRGIGREMTIHCLKMAREMDYKISVLRASNLGEAVYRNLGFKTFGHFHKYRLNPDSFKNQIWKLNYYIRYLKDKFTGDAIWFS